MALVLDYDFPADAAAQDELKRTLAKDVAAALGVEPSRLVVTGMRAGSVIFEFTFAPWLPPGGPTGDDPPGGGAPPPPGIPSAADLRAEFERQVRDETSKLSTGAITGKLDRERTIKQTAAAAGGAVGAAGPAEEAAVPAADEAAPAAEAKAEEEEEEEEVAEKKEEEKEEEAAEVAPAAPAADKPDEPSAEDRAAVRITHFVRGVAARKSGIEYRRSFGDGPLGMMVDKLVVSFVADEGQAHDLKVATGSRLVSINGRGMDSDLDMVTAVQTMKRPLEMVFRLKKKPDASTRYSMAWQLELGAAGGAMQGPKAAKKWKAKHLELSGSAEDGEPAVLSSRAKEKSKSRDELPLARCRVEELTAEGGFGDFVEAHTAGQFKKTEGALFFFRVVDVEAEAEAEADPKKKKKKGAVESFVLCLDDANEFKSWLQLLQRRCGGGK